jgi:uncharacterized protein (TIGR00369 family)
VTTIPVPPAAEFAPLPDDQAARWSNFARRQQGHFGGLLGVHIEELRVGWCRMRLPFRPELTQPAGFIHGGAIASLIDTVAVPAIGSGFETDTPYATVDMHVQFLGAATDVDLLATGWVSRRGRSIAFCRAEVATEDGRAIASGALAFKVG